MVYAGLQLIFFGLLLMRLCASSSFNGTMINSSEELVQYVCNDGYYENILLQMNSTILYHLPASCSCIKSNVNITIVSSSLQYANIVCDDRAGRFVFINSSVKICNVQFISCGMALNDTELHKVFSATFNIDHLNAIFIFIETPVKIYHVHFRKSNGISIFGINMGNYSHISNVNVSDSSHHGHVGNGIVLLFIKQCIKTDLSSKYQFKIENSYFYNNTGYHDGDDFECSYYFDAETHFRNSLGLTILFLGNASNNIAHCIHTSVSVSHCIFEDNHSNGMGVMSVMHYNELYASTIITDCAFINNYNYHKYCGAGLSFWWNNSDVYHDAYTSTPISVHGSIFTDTKLHGRANRQIFLGFSNQEIDINVLFLNIICDVSHFKVGGPCMFSHVYHSHGTITLLLQDTQLIGHRNTCRSIFLHSGMFYFYRVGNVIINGTSKFADSPISAVFGQQTQLLLGGNITFSGNRGIGGGAIHLSDYSSLTFLRGVQAKFIDNEATRAGGAIYVSNYVNAVKEVHSFCAILLNDDCTDIYLEFRNNTARDAGSCVFAYPLYSCRECSKVIKSCTCSLMKLSNLHDTTTGLNSVLPISTYPDHINIAEANVPPRYAGETMYFHINASDDKNQSVYSSITIIITDNYHNHIWVSPHEEEQTLVENQSHTKIGITLHTNVTINKRINGSLVFMTPMMQIQRLVNFTIILPCPLGFSLNTSTGTCDCAEALKYFSTSEDITLECTVVEQKIDLSRAREIFWLGLTNNQVLGISKHCPTRYCSFCTDNVFYSVNNTIRCSSNYKMPYCIYNRAGTLCGRCKSSNYSIIFGSTECKDCSNYWLLTIILYISVGPLIVYLLFKLNLTLTAGTLNGVIFYANAANCGLLEILTIILELYDRKTPIYILTQLAYSFISFLNLNLGFPLCFYNGMNELWKAGLSLLFPVYLLTIVVFLILISHYSTWLSNRTSHSSVQVLVTIIYLSFSKLLLAILDVFASAKVYTANETYHVWYWDGNVQYMNREHGILVGISLSIIIPVLLPFIFLLVFTKLMRCWVLYQYIRPVLEAIYGPYKDSKRYWFVLRLFLIMYMCAIYIIYRSVNIYLLYVCTSPVLLLYVVVQTFSKPYKNKYINILDTFVMFNLMFLYVTTWYFLYCERNPIYAVITFVPVFIIFITVVVIVCSHTVTALGYSDAASLKIQLLFSNLRKLLRKFHASTSSVPGLHSLEIKDITACDLPYAQYREELLEFEEDK